MSTGSLRRRLFAGINIFLLSFQLLTLSLPVHAQEGEGAFRASTAIMAESGSDAAAATLEAEDAIRHPETPDTSQGICGSTFAGYMCQAVTYVLGLTAGFLGAIILVLLNILIAFAKYNAFNSSDIVNQGWPVVRDVVNMFFIVILLISAFATIIGVPEEFHYKKVLPKLLLSAVLINFSRTLIQLMVDFSQVVMLTFVNAFAQAAAGNFVSALGLDRIMSIAQQNTTITGTVESGITMVNIVIAYMLANFMLAIMLGVVTIMTGFLIVRIVIIWISLVLSPIAFFSSALPPTAKKALGAFTGDYWDKLTNALIGGPVLAFFLWLTLAVVQSANSTGSSISRTLNFELPDGSLQAAITSIGDSNSIASFIVGITLMLTGLSFAVSLSGKLGVSAFKGFAESISGRAQQAGRFFATLPFTATGGAVRAGAREADRRFQLTQRASTAFSQTRAGQALATNRFVGGAVRERLRAGMTSGQKEVAKGGAEITGFQKDVLQSLPQSERDAFVQRVLNSNPSTPEAKRSYQEFAEYVRSDDYRKTYQRNNEKKYVDGLKGITGMSEDDAKNGSKVLVEQDVMKQEREAFQKDLAFARERRDYQRVADLEKQEKLKPYLASEKDRSQYITDLAKDADKYKEISPFDAASGELLTEMMKANGYEADKNTGELKLKDAAAYDRLKSSVKASKNQTLLGMLEAHEEFIKNSPGITETKAKGLQHRYNAGDKTYQTFDVSRKANGAWEEGKSGTRVRNGNQKAAFDALSAAGKDRAKGTSVDSAQAMKFMDNGGRLAEYLKITNNDQDDQPAKDLGKEVDQLAKKASEAFALSVSSTASNEEKAKAKEAGVAAIQSNQKILNQLDEKGVSTTVQVEVVSKFGDGRIDNIIQNYGPLPDPSRRGVVKLGEVSIRRADDIRQSGTDPAAYTAEQRRTLEVADKITAWASKRDSNAPSELKRIVRERGAEAPASS